MSGPRAHRVGTERTALQIHLDVVIKARRHLPDQPRAGGDLMERSERAGLRQGDIIVAFNDSPVQHIDALHLALTDHQPGIRSSITVIRGTEKLPLTIEPSLL